MSALPADIAAASRDVVTGTFANTAIAARYPSARDGSVSPSTGYFDAVGESATVATARGALIGVERRRFAVGVADVIWPSVSTGLPQVRLVDADQSVDGTFLVARVELDLETETTTYELYG
ncbi:hypothetical protein [Sphingomonas sp. PAMC 26621]|uniref:hypothetical protein n=1 Tax=Sphingomonas sp. PAMC 26621 TaxID=1112213 RepID=UPI00028892A8|nr:hypothetical protein [Sphingomonas sp. PAMC 26621]